MYHMLGNAPVHTKGGITKESLPARELLDSTLSIPAAARDAIQAALSDTPGGARFSAQR
jgi:hypothetical protein